MFQLKVKNDKKIKNRTGTKDIRILNKKRKEN